MLVQNATILSKYLIEQQFSNIYLLGEGWSSVVFQADDFIIRFPKHDLQDYIKEQEVCDFLRDKTSVLLPKTELCLGKIPYIKHKKIIGHNWNLSTLNILSATEQTALANDIASFFYTIHQQKTKYLAPTFVPVKLTEIINAFTNSLDSKLLLELSDIYADTVITPSQSFSLIHADFSYENTTLDENKRLYGVFDWCNSGMGDFMLDFVNLYIFFPKHFVTSVINQYQELSESDFDFFRFKKLYLLRSMYLLYWKHHKSNLKSTDLSCKITEILNKVTL